MTIVETARAVLEQELRASPLAQPSAGPPAAAQPDPAARQRAHAALDAILDTLAALRGRGRDLVSASLSEVQLPVLSVDRPTPAGSEARLTTAVVADGSTPTEVRFAVTDLVSEAGARIPAAAVEPTPATLTLRGSNPVPLVVQIRVPRDASPGRYIGLLRAINLDDLRA
ncbi:MAG: hypothetical protein JO023_22215, partial [Chloroflexi bacterium]|nr:hypothetical protein [Chloroflexota bacterium]